MSVFMLHPLLADLFPRTLVVIQDLHDVQRNQ